MFRARAFAASLIVVWGIVYSVPARPQDGTWAALTPPTARVAHTAIYDSAQDCMFVFGGVTLGVERLDLWRLSLGDTPTWVSMTPTTPPISQRQGHTAVYDPVRGTMIVFGGLSIGSAMQDVWEVSLSDEPWWNELSPTGTAPAGRYNHTAIYDPIRDRMIVYGGSSGSGEVWALSLAGTPAWTQLVPTGTAPEARSGHSAIYDPIGDRMVIFGGQSTSSSAPLNDVWALSLAGAPAWSQVVPSGSSPAARYAHTAIYQSTGQRMIVYGGTPSISAGDTWALTLGATPTWTQLAPANAPTGRRWAHSAIYQPRLNRMLVFGKPEAGLHNDVIALSLDEAPAWGEVASGVYEPYRPDYFYKAVSDPVRNRMVVFGGSATSPDTQHGACYAFSPGTVPFEWTYLAWTAAAPDRRQGHSMIYYPPEDAIIVYGGDNQGGISPGVENAVWRARLSSYPLAWQQLTFSAPVPNVLKRHHHSAIYDPHLHRMVVFGGQDAAGVYHSDVWAIDPYAATPAWTQLLPDTAPGAPSPRAGHSAIYLPIGNTMVVFGDNSSGMDLQVHCLDLSTPAWGDSSDAGADNTLWRASHSAVYDPEYHRMLVFGGGWPYWNDVWAFNFVRDINYGWHALTTSGGAPSPRAVHAAVYDSATHSMLVFGGFAEGGYDADVMALQLPTPVVDAGPTEPLVLNGAVAVRPNPTTGGVDILLDVKACAGALGVDVVDVCGRVVWHRSLGSGAESTRLHWNGNDRAGAKVAAGVYFARVRGADVRAARLVVLD